MDASLPSTSAMAATYESGQTSSVDPMDLTISETMEKLNGVRQEVSEMSNKITYLREIRGRALALLAQADAAEEEANRLELEQVTLDKEVERLTAVVFRMEDMRFSTKQLTDQMQLDTALQVPANPRMKRNHSEEGGSNADQPLFKMPRRDTSSDLTPTPLSNNVNNSGIGGGALTRPGSANSPSNGTIHKYSPNRALSLTPGSLASIAALAGGEPPRSLPSQRLPGSQNASVSPPSLPTASSGASSHYVASMPYSLGSGSGMGGGGGSNGAGIMYHHPPGSNLSSSSLPQQKVGAEDAEEDGPPTRGRDLLYR
ncbi:hypothetical protein FRB96_001529 [Tulasnella sp. 330]|nr:hypothetical protein FRB96_001529 [Tulasnella sp. 330]KAG8886602.1 hypothetical protein FRB97_000021 [Tulasnella sp. 331]